VNGCNYQAIAQAATPVGPLAIERGFVAVDARVDDTDYRFVNTHLEVRALDPTDPLSSFFQAAQAAELIQTLALTTPGDRTLIVVGDINSSPEGLGVPGPLPLPPPFDEGIMPPYMQFVLSGYTDIWTLGSEPADGATCCQAPDLSNATSLLDERIDMIFAGELPFEVKDVELVGDHASDKTPPPGPALWPSDHAAVEAEFAF
jgi:endonuclease/exonuclease/phosphatase family metal-dependent hydrolase